MKIDDINELIDFSKSLLLQAIDKASQDKPVFITKRLHFSWTAFAEELSKLKNENLAVSELRTHMSEHLQPLIAKLTSQIQKAQRINRMEKYEEYLRAHAAEIQHLRRNYQEDHAAEMRLLSETAQALSYENAPAGL